MTLALAADRHFSSSSEFEEDSDDSIKDKDYAVDSDEFSDSGDSSEMENDERSETSESTANDSVPSTSINIFSAAEWVSVNISHKSLFDTVCQDVDRPNIAVKIMNTYRFF